MSPACRVRRQRRSASCSPAATLREYLGCHATVNGAGAVVKGGVDCERCHAGAAEHKSVANPVKLSAAAQVELCAACHRLTPPPGLSPRDPLLIRFQPLRLVKSKCYATGRLTCGSCHAAHENAGTNARVQSRAQCLQYHAQPHRAQEDCVGCHMPRSSPAPYLNFTDHWITIQSRIRP
ncbi:MAG: hypothetical protein FJW31_28415 [Acidobacteria bacterium]|nr:hypothetical protein [Acidobacteriota bacterium]